MPKFSVQLELNGRPHQVVLEADSMPDEASIMGALKGSAYDPDRKPATAEQFAPKQYGNWSSEQEGSSLGRTLHHGWDAFNPFAGIAGMGANIAKEYADLDKGTYTHYLDPFTKSLIAAGKGIGKPMWNAMAEEGRQVPGAIAKAWHDPSALNVADAVSHTLGTLPLVGPAGVAARQSAESGDTAGAVGTALGTGLGFVAAPKMNALAGDAMRAAQRGARATAEMHLGALLKTTKSLKNAYPGVNIPGAVLDQDLLQRQGRFSPFGSARKSVEMGETRIGEFADQNTAALQNFSGGKQSLQPVLDSLDSAIARQRGSITGMADVAKLEALKQEILNHPDYSKPVMGLVDGQWVPTGRRVLKDLPVERIDQLKKDVYAGNAGNYGKWHGPFADPARVVGEKAVGRGLKQVLENAVPEVRDINAQQRATIAAKYALEEMAGREANKFKQGLMDFGALSVGAGGPLLGIPGTAPLAAGYGAYSMLLKHPSTAIPVIKAMNNVSKSAALRTGAKALGTAATGGIYANQAMRPLKKAEFNSLKDALANDPDL